ncbi:hydroxymethylpyrimidine/phosphomethylpyrimidine kinase [Herbaspirillum sp. Sphag1AN]|uniref:bifunctional hydroxymethylpyrimidine kinase/phosphomethylpyrimidine kinase n=1 Tax=unclassified Herbaspirillum TaxID=2624150 RepID=UPI00161AD0A4|nr:MULTISPECIES: hydroxymethylpyrimidine/phosphomethylpyrimidine kinase [unclassified Herbaspirillum]MBB3213829.1 hydroxymethylpyrimidine/phosphomethylpyrimidine kinase [Herbaspirillum sp. Sphag1AN]MBB3247026.1 hydroxymethylpyrimidine/phosphomethylpyrimidine kinase [Herbaspirillum sp. Sphag64]
MSALVSTYRSSPPCVLVFSGSDPSGGAGLQADIPAITALGCHPLSVPTALTVQDNVSVFAVHPLDPELIRHQAQVLIDRFKISAVKLGIAGNRRNAGMIAQLIQQLRQQQPDLPVVFDPVLANGKGDQLSTDDAARALESLYAVATVITPNLNEANRLCGSEHSPEQQAAILMQRGCQHVLLKGGHGPQEQDVVNRWFGPEAAFAAWTWSRLPDEFHGSGCTLAAALSAQLALGLGMQEAIAAAQRYCQHALNTSYAIAAGQRIPSRVPLFAGEHP